MPRGYVAPIGFFNLLGFHLAPRRPAPCFMRLTLMGFRLQGACAPRTDALLSESRVPSCRCFQNLFPSEEWKRTGSPGFRVLGRPERRTRRNSDPKAPFTTGSAPSWCFRPSRVLPPVRFVPCGVKPQGVLPALGRLRLFRGLSRGNPDGRPCLKDSFPDRIGLSFSRPPTLLGFSAS